MLVGKILLMTKQFNLDRSQDRSQYRSRDHRRHLSQERSRASTRDLSYHQNETSARRISRSRSRSDSADRRRDRSRSRDRETIQHKSMKVTIPNELFDRQSEQHRSHYTRYHEDDYINDVFDSDDDRYKFDKQSSRYSFTNQRALVIRVHSSDQRKASMKAFTNLSNYSELLFGIDHWQDGNKQRHSRGNLRRAHPS